MLLDKIGGEGGGGGGERRRWLFLLAGPLAVYSNKDGRFGKFSSLEATASGYGFNYRSKIGL